MELFIHRHLLTLSSNSGALVSGMGARGGLESFGSVSIQDSYISLPAIKCANGFGKETSHTKEGTSRSNAPSQTLTLRSTDIPRFIALHRCCVFLKKAKARPSSSKDYDHFTRVVWKRTRNTSEVHLYPCPNPLSTPRSPS